MLGEVKKRKARNELGPRPERIRGLHWEKTTQDKYRELGDAYVKVGGNKGKELKEVLKCTKRIT